MRYEVPELMIAALEHLSKEIERVMWNRTQEEYIAPTRSHDCADEFRTDSFVMRRYCWCDGRTHEDGCPPNFEWKDARINWYKHGWRGLSSNVELTPDRINDLLEDCLRSVKEMDATYF